MAARIADTEHMDPVAAAAAAAAADLATVDIQFSQHRSNFAVLHNPFQIQFKPKWQRSETDNYEEV